MSGGTQRRYVAFLRAISNASMEPFRRRMEALGFSAVESYGMSGNLLFTTGRSDTADLERLIGSAFGTIAVVRSRAQLARSVADDPIGSSMMLLGRTPSPARRRTLYVLDFEAPRPVLQGKTVYFVYPPRLRGKRAAFDFERALGVAGTARSARVVRQLLTRLSGGESRGGRRRPPP